METQVLIIDDEKDLTATLKKYLARKGYSVTTCANGTEGIDEAGKNKYALIIVDIRLPDISGVEVIKTIENRDDQVRFLIITGYSIVGETSDLIETSKRVHGYIFKPFKPSHLEEKIKEILDLPR